MNAIKIAANLLAEGWKYQTAFPPEKKALYAAGQLIGAAQETLRGTKYCVEEIEQIMLKSGTELPLHDFAKELAGASPEDIAAAAREEWASPKYADMREARRVAYEAHAAKCAAACAAAPEQEPKEQRGGLRRQDRLDDSRFYRG